MKETYGVALPGMDLDDLVGKLIVIEGTDGVGRSTQIACSRNGSSRRATPCSTLDCTRSGLVGKSIKRAKEGHTLGRITLSLFYATDFADRLENEIVPALRAGFVVLTDRYTYSLIARAMVRGLDPVWIRNIHRFALKPDAVFYLRIGVDELIPRAVFTRGFDYWESGIDLYSTEDMYESFRRYQSALDRAVRQACRRVSLRSHRRARRASCDLRAVAPSHRTPAGWLWSSAIGRRPPHSWCQRCLRRPSHLALRSRRPASRLLPNRGSSPCRNAPSERQSVATRPESSSVSPVSRENADRLAHLSVAARALDRSLRRVRTEQALAVEASRPSPVHDLRVALRRCRSLAEGFSDLNPHPGWRHLRKACKELLRGLADLRDAQVMDEWVRRLGFNKGPVGACSRGGCLARGRRHARRSARRTLKNFSGKRWKRWRRRLPERAARISADDAHFARLALRRLAEARALEAVGAKAAAVKPLTGCASR